MSLLKTKRFLPLFLTQFLGAFNDNVFKNALVMLITYKIASAHAPQLVTLAAGIFILPFFLFSATAGQLADKYDRAKITRIIKGVEIAIMVVATIGFIAQSVPMLMVVLFAMGTHSSFFGPIKYALLPQHLRDHELLAGNALVEAGTFLAILLGTIGGGVLIMQSAGAAIVSLCLLAIAAAGFVTSKYIPNAPAPQPELVVERNIWKATWDVIGYARQDRSVFLSIIGISWFWFVGATYLAQLPTFAKDVLHAAPYMVTVFLTVFSVGIGVGSLAANRLNRGHIQVTYVPLAAISMAVFGVDLYFAAQDTVARVLIDLFCIAVSAGIYIVPLYVLMQHNSEPEKRARIIAANNIMNALFMVGSAVLTVVLFALHYTIPQIFLLVALFNALAAVHVCRLLPDALMRSVVRAIFSVLYRVEVKGIDNFTNNGERLLLVANHTSFLDAALVAAYFPKKITFAVNTHIASRWWMKPLLSLVDALPLDPTNPLATKTLIDRLKAGHTCMIFPEGRITITGALMKIYEGPGMIADKSGARLLPIRIDGAQYTPFSRLRGKVRIRLFPKISMTVLPPCGFDLPADVKGRRRRQLASAKLYDVMSGMIFDTSATNKTLYAALLDAMAVHGGGHVIVEDIERRPLSYRTFVARIIILGRVLRQLMQKEQYIGVLLPNAVSTAVTFFAVQFIGRVPAMLNFSVGVAALLGACKTAAIRSVITSRRFIELARLGDMVSALEAANITVIYLEDIRPNITAADKILGALSAFVPALSAPRTNPESAAVVLFTSGSEGTPKGVVLSHKNIQANRYQLSARVDFGPQDIVFNCLPMFHSFGLTGGTLLPLLSGIRTFFYPSPLHYRIVPELVYDTNATILFGTDTFLSGYAKYAHPYDFHSVRYVFAGAEKLKEETRKVYAEKFGVRIFEGYGATETAPVLATNTPMAARAGTVGRLMPSIAHRLETVEGIDEGGRLLVQGPNVMLGYLRDTNPGEIEPLADGWYDTGDIVSVDADAFVTIKGRTKRFAKIGGEMVSLTTVELALQSLWPDSAHAAVSLPDEKKGEQIAVMTTRSGADRSEIIKHFKESKINELAVPRKICEVRSLPLLGTGKVDYQAVKAAILSNSGTE